MTMAGTLAQWRDGPRQLLLGAVHAYRFAISPWLGSSCRFEPSCSAYAIDALRLHGALAGSALAAGRVLRCHPWCAGGRDDVPPPGHGLFTGLLARDVSRVPSTSSSAEKNLP